MSDDKVEKPFAPYKIDIGKDLGLDRKFEVEVHSTANIIASGAIVVCAPVRNSVPVDEYIPGSSQVNCSVCNQPVWVAPSGQRILAAGKNQPICMDCFRHMKGADGAA
jgi:LSD1 subclass zinc finger protein